MPMPESSAVTQVPIFWPSIIGIAMPQLIAPVIDSACSMPTDAEEDCIIAVSSKPAISPNSGLSNISSTFAKFGSSASGFTALLIWSMPNMSTAKPTSMPPVSWRLEFLENIIIATPTSASTGVNEVGLSSCIHTLSPCMPVRLSIQAVMVVPMLAPIMTGVAWYSCMTPELTKPTIVTVVAEDDCIIAVTPAPNSTPLSRLLVSFSSIDARRPPDSFSSPWPICCIP